MCTISNEKNKSIKNLIFTNLFWYFDSKQTKAKYTNRITGEVKAKTIYMLIQKIVKSPVIITNKYKGIKADELENYGNY